MAGLEPSMEKTLYILIGPQGSGKTYWATNVLLAHDQTGIIRISQDEQGKGGHHKLFKKSLEQGLSIVVDRMNFNFEQRARYTERAFRFGYNIIFVWFDVNRETCLRRLANRQNHPTVSKTSNHESMLDSYFNEFEFPHCDEYHEMLTVGNKNNCRMLDLRNKCYQNDNKIIVVGDIHGCYDEFIALLDDCKYSVGDIVVATGDLIDRGPKIRETLMWFRNAPGAYSVEGNHENKFKRYLTGNPVKITNGLNHTIEQCDDFNPTEWGAWFQYLPQMIRLPDVNNKPVYVVHAGVDGRKPINKQPAEICLYTRYLDGSDFFDEKNGVEWWTTLDNSYTILSGHIISENAHPCESAYCLDGGACEGSKLRALVIDDDTLQIHEVNCYDRP
jgi:predicted kinase